MKIERKILIAFLGNYLINNVVAALASLVPPSTGSSSFFTPQYSTFLAIAVVAVALLTWWYLAPLSRGKALMWGTIFGIAGFVVAIVMAFITGVSGVLIQTGSLSELWSVLPNFGPFLWSWSTLAMLCYWVIPAAIIGFLMQRMSKKPMPMPASTSMPTGMPSRPTMQI